MAKLISNFLLTVCCCSLAGCMGTIQSRVTPCGPRFLGWPIYSGILSDVNVVIEEQPSSTSGIGMLFTWLSFPLDFVFDTALLVPDLCAGAFGWRKAGCPPAADESDSTQDSVRPNTTQQPTGDPSGAGG